MPDSIVFAAGSPPISALILLSGYCLLVVVASLAGGSLPSVVRLTHTRLQIVISFVGGLMLGIAVFHLLPHAQHELRDIDTVMIWLMSGIITMFLLIRLFHFHNHGIAEDDESRACDHEDHRDDHAHSHSHLHSHQRPHEISWIGILAGLSVHTLLDGIALGSVVGSASAEAGGGFPGFGVFLAIMLHKPLDALSITSLMVAGRWTHRMRQVVNAGFAMMCPLGAALFLLGTGQFPGLQSELAGSAMAFSAGVFLCISLSDLLPEMEFHSHHRLQLSASLAAGILVAWAVRLLEPGHLP